MANPVHQLQVKPRLEKSGNLVWELCYTNPTSPQVTRCGDTQATYPTVVLGYKTGAHPFQFTITDDQTGLGIKFAPEPLWITRETKPTGPGVDKLITNAAGKGTQKLTFVDLNNNKNPNNDTPVTLKYQLNFTDKYGKKVAALDPDITNGGTNLWGSEEAPTLLILGAVALALLAAWGVKVARSRRSAAGR